MDHPFHNIGDGLFSKKGLLSFLKKKELNKFVDLNCDYSLNLVPNSRFINNDQILNSSLMIHYKFIDKKKYKNNFFKQLKCVAPKYINKFFFPKNYRDSHEFTIKLLSDQKPEYENKIILSDKLDSFGIPQPIIYWKRSNNIRISSRKIIENLGIFFIDNNLGRIAAQDFLFNNNYFEHKNGYHHMGGTIMGKDINNSVVDKNLKVHDTKNLFICGSSVFCTGGYAHPTLTIVKLALRLSQHLINNLKKNA